MVRLVRAPLVSAEAPVQCLGHHSLDGCSPSIRNNSKLAHRFIIERIDWK
ncbi:MAG TPA: hypothetical protein VFS90_24805 [Pyrinomonadaceae bacterium]|nr:hypothetical protein [Pyrinomonadaceae bacterium]